MALIGEMIVHGRIKTLYHNIKSITVVLPEYVTVKIAHFIDIIDRCEHGNEPISTTEYKFPWRFFSKNYTDGFIDIRYIYLLLKKYYGYEQMIDENVVYNKDNGEKEDDSPGEFFVLDN